MKHSSRLDLVSGQAQHLTSFVNQIPVESCSFTHGFRPSGFKGFTAVTAGGFSGDDIAGGEDLDQDDGLRNENILVS
jgi:hypothetical protein